MICLPTLTTAACSTSRTLPALRCPSRSETNGRHELEGSGSGRSLSDWSWNAGKGQLTPGQSIQTQVRASPVKLGRNRRGCRQLHDTYTLPNRSPGTTKVMTPRNREIWTLWHCALFKATAPSETFPRPATTLRRIRRPGPHRRQTRKGKPPAARRSSFALLRQEPLGVQGCHASHPR